MASDIFNDKPDNPLAVPGSNNPPPDLKLGDELLEQLSAENLKLTQRQIELLEAVNRAPATVESDEVASNMAAFLKQINDFVKSAKVAHDDKKAPYLNGGRIVDNWFAQLTLPLTKAFTMLNQRQTTFLTAKAAKARREAEEKAAAERAEADRKRREAEKAEADRRRAERDAKKAQDDAARQAADARAAQANAAAEEARRLQAEADAAAQAAAKTATASDAALARTHGDYAMATLRKVWTYEVVDLAKVPVEYLTVNDRVIKAAISGKDGKRDIPGLRIFDQNAAVSR